MRTKATRRRLPHRVRTRVLLIRRARRKPRPLIPQANRALRAHRRKARHIPRPGPVLSQAPRPSRQQRRSMKARLDLVRLRRVHPGRPPSRRLLPGQRPLRSRQNPALLRRRNHPRKKSISEGELIRTSIPWPVLASRTGQFCLQGRQLFCVLTASVGLSALVRISARKCRDWRGSKSSLLQFFTTTVALKSYPRAGSWAHLSRDNTSRDNTSRTTADRTRYEIRVAEQAASEQSLTGRARPPRSINYYVIRETSTPMDERHRRAPCPRPGRCMYGLLPKPDTDLNCRGTGDANDRNGKYQ